MGQWSVRENAPNNSILSSDRMNMLEELMGSVAHEVRNPLAVVRANLQLLLLKDDLTSRHADFRGMIGNLDSALELLTEFLQTLKPQLNAPVETDVNAVILSIRRLLEAEALRQGHCLRFELDKRAPARQINPSQMIHIIYNMCFIAFKYLSVSGDVVIRSTMQEDHTLACIAVSTTKTSRWENPENVVTPEGVDQMARVCRTIADDLNARFEMSPLASQGVEVAMIFAS